MQRVFYIVALLCCVLGLGFMLVKHMNKKADVANNKPLEITQKQANPKNKDNSPSSPTMKPKQSDDDKKKTYVAIIIDDVGLNKSALDVVFSLPKDITLGFSPYPDNVTDLIDRATNIGFESLIKVPMQTNLYPLEDLGPYMLLDDLSDAENESRMQFIVSRSDEVVGIYTNHSEIFTDYLENVVHLVKFLAVTFNTAKRDMFFLYMDEQDKKPVTRIANELNVLEHFGLIDLWLNQEANKESMMQMLSDLEVIAKSRGIGIALIPAYPIYFEVLETWLKDIDQKNLDIKPISFVLKRRSQLANN